MAQRSDSWFEVDREGLARTLERRGKFFAIAELWQNAVDTGAKNVAITLDGVLRNGTRKSRLVVEDDDPDGFKDLTHAYTLFAPSEKAGKADKRGRFNIGEKLVLALCEDATITSTKGRVIFYRDGRRTRDGFTREAGTLVEATIRMNAQEREEVARLVPTLIVPDGVTATFNGQVIEHREAFKEIEVRLQTEIADEEGRLRPTARLTTVRLYEPREGETPSIYELGIPVVEHDCRWHADVQQKVPLNFERDNVSMAFRRHLWTAILNATHEEITTDDATSAWVGDALPMATPEAVRDVVRQRFGDKVVAYDPSDVEGTKIAVSKGYTVVSGGTFSGDQWRAIRDAEAIFPAGKVTPSPAVLISMTDGKPPIPEDEWTDAQRVVAAYAKRMGRLLISGGEIGVEIRHSDQPFRAWYGGRVLTFNQRVLHRPWFADALVDTADLDGLLVHELAHESVSDHLSSEFAAECCRLGAKLHRQNVQMWVAKEGVLA